MPFHLLRRMMRGMIMSPKSSKQQLDELLGILDDVKSSIPQASSTAVTASVPTEQLIPDDLPDSGTAAVSAAPTPPPAPTVPTPAPQQATPPTPVASQGLNVLEQDDHELAQTQRNLAEIDELIVVSKNVMNHVYGVVTSTDILDAATIAAAAKLINETRALIAEHLTIQKDERDFLNKVQMEEIKHRHQMELMEKKFELEQKRFQQKNPAMNAPANNVQPMTPASASNGMKAYSSADLRKMLEEE